MTWKKVSNSDAGTTDIFGGDDIDKISDAFSGVDVDDFDINCDIKIRNSKLSIANPANTFNYLLVSSAIAANRNITIPLLTTDDVLTTADFTQTLKNKTLDSSNTISSTASLPSAVVTEDAANSFGDFDNSWKDNRIRIWNPADTFRYTITAAAIAADRTLNLPLITGTDTLASLGLAQTYTAAQTMGARLDINKELIKSGVTSPSQITSDQNDYNPSGLTTSTILRLDADSSFRTITGIVPTANQEVKLENISANTILLKNQSTGSSANNRFEFGGYDIPLFPKSQLTLNYDNTSTKWRLDGAQQYIIPPIGMGFHYANDCFGSGSDAFTSTTAASGGSITAVGSVAGHPGVINFTSGTSTTGNGIIRTTSNAAIFLIGNNWYYRTDAIVRLSVLSDGTNTYELFIGLADQWSAEPVDGCYFRYTNSVNSGKWELVARQNNTETVTNATNTAVAAATWYHLTVIVNPAGTLAEYFQDGVSLGTVATNLPTGAGRGTSSGAGFLKSAGTADIAFLDVDSISGIAYANVTR